MSAPTIGEGSDASLTRVDPRSLLVFGAVCRAGSMSAAAQSLGWTQPAVSQHVRRLERILGIPLVVRQGRGIEITPAGRDLHRYADAVAASLQDAEQTMRAHVHAKAGIVRVAAFPSAMASVVSRSVRKLAESNPGLDVELVQVEPPEAMSMLKEGACDVALIFEYAEENLDVAQFDVHPLDSDPLMAVLPASHPLSDHGAVDLSALADERWVTGCPHCRGHLLHATARHGFVPDIRHSTDDYVVVQALVADDLAVAVLPAMALAASTHPDVRALEIIGEPPRRVLACTRPAAARVPAVRAVVATLQSSSAVAGHAESSARRIGPPSTHTSRA